METASFVPCGPPRALQTEELPGIVDQYRQAAVRAQRAGFDFVEVHSANGYLLQQFLSTNTNQRSDQYGGSLENRARLTLEVVDAVIGVMRAGRVGVRLSPHFNANDIDDAETEFITLYLARELSQRGVAYLHIAEAGGWIGGGGAVGRFPASIAAGVRWMPDFLRRPNGRKRGALAGGGRGRRHWIWATVHRQSGSGRAHSPRCDMEHAG